MKQVVVQSTGDALDEDDEKFQLLLSGPVYAVLEDPIGVGTITDDDPMPVLSIAHASANENNTAGALSFTITLSAVSGRDVTVVYTTADGTATSGDDYTAVTATAMIIAGNDTTTIEIDITADSTAENNETFTVQFLAASSDGTLQTVNATISPTADTATGTIENDD